MRPARTAVTTAALRRTTQRLVFGGGRAALIATPSGGDRSSAFLTVPCQYFGGPERPAASGDLLPAGLVAEGRITLQRNPIGGGRGGLGRQSTRGPGAGGAGGSGK